MQCEQVREFIDLYMDNALSEEQTLQVDRHLIRCALCGGEVRALEQAKKALIEAVPPVSASPSFRERTAARLLDKLKTHVRPNQSILFDRQWSLPFTIEEENHKELSR